MARGMRLNICMITREFPPEPGGIGYFVYSLSKKLVEKGHEVTVVTRGSTKRTNRKVVDGINVFEATFFPAYPFHLSIHGFFVNSVLKALESDMSLVHFHSPVTPAVHTKLPTIVTVHTTMKVDARYHESDNIYLFAEKWQSLTVSSRAELKLFRLAGKLTSVSGSVARELAEYGIETENVTVIGNGVDEKLFTPAKTKRQDSYVLYTGVLRARKGLFDLVECARLVSKEYPDTKFVILGKGPLLGPLKEYVRKMKIEKNVVFLGYVTREQLIETYQNASVHVVPSVYEGLPTVLLEAMASGLPVVATTVGGNADVISNGVNGFLVPPRSPGEMSKKIATLLDDASLRRKIGNAARKTIEERYTWDRITDNVLRSYQEIIEA